jgi:hypothetical protein
MPPDPLPTPITKAPPHYADIVDEFGNWKWFSPSMACNQIQHGRYTDYSPRDLADLARANPNLLVPAHLGFFYAGPYTPEQFAAMDPLQLWNNS